MSDLPTNLKNKYISKIASRQFWYNQELVSSCCPVFIVDEASKCWKIFFDDENDVWAIEPSNLPFPKIGAQIGDDEMKWYDGEFESKLPLIGLQITDFTTNFNGHWSNGILSLTEGVQIKLSYNFETDYASYEVMPNL